MNNVDAHKKILTKTVKLISSLMPIASAVESDQFTAADRQRRVWVGTGDLRAVVDFIVEATVPA